MRVVWSRRAIRNLKHLRDYIAKDNPERAAAVATRILEAIETLQRNPEIGRPGRILGTRELVIAGTSYIVPYRFRGERLELIALFHGRQKWPEKL